MSHTCPIKCRPTNTINIYFIKKSATLNHHINGICKLDRRCSILWSESSPSSNVKLIEREISIRISDVQNVLFRMNTTRYNAIFTSISTHVPNDVIHSMRVTQRIHSTSPTATLFQVRLDSDPLSSGPLRLFPLHARVTNCRVEWRHAERCRNWGEGGAHRSTDPHPYSNVPSRRTCLL